MFEIDFLQAKLHGIHSKSIVGHNFERLKRITSIETLAKELFPGETFNIPEDRLYNTLEKKIKRKIFNQINYISKFFEFKNKLINNLMLSFELDNVKLLVKAHYNKMSSPPELFEFELKDTLNYKLIYKLDISKFENIKKILKKTIFSFLIPEIEEKKEAFFIDNILDKFYYENLLKSLNKISLYEREKFQKIIIEEINWQNIIWAFRMKIYFDKSFVKAVQTFMKDIKFISTRKLENIFKLQFVSNEAVKLFKEFPNQYYKIIMKSFKENGDFDLPLLEQNVCDHLIGLYTEYFYIENFNILPLISFIYIKLREYFNVVRLIESIRYKLTERDKG